MNRPPLILPFILSLLTLFFSTLFFPSIRLVVFAPFLAVVILRKPLLLGLWAATLCGLLTDLLSSDTRFGMFALSYLIVALLLYRYKTHFFEETKRSIPLFTIFFSLIFSLIHTFLIAFFHEAISLDWKGVLTTFFLMPLVDGLYAFFWFTCPMLLYTIFSLRKRNSSAKRSYYS